MNIHTHHYFVLLSPNPQIFSKFEFEEVEKKILKNKFTVQCRSIITIILIKNNYNVLIN